MDRPSYSKIPLDGNANAANTHITIRTEPPSTLEQDDGSNPQKWFTTIIATTVTLQACARRRAIVRNAAHRLGSHYGAKKSAESAPPRQHQNHIDAASTFNQFGAHWWGAGLRWEWRSKEQKHNDTI